MKVQKITNTSIYSRACDRGNTVNFCGKAKDTARVAGREYSAKVAKDAVKKQRTAFDELLDLTVNSAKALKQSYDKSGIKRVVVQPLYDGWNKFSKTAPIISKATAYTACATVGLGILQAIKSDSEE